MTGHLWTKTPNTGSTKYYQTKKIGAHYTVKISGASKYN